MWEMAVHLDIADDIFDGILICAVPFAQHVLNEICD